MTPLQEVMEYLRLRMEYHEKIGKDLPVRERRYLECYQREDHIILRFLQAVERNDEKEINRLTKRMTTLLDVTQSRLGF